MKPLKSSPSLSDQVYWAIAEDILEGRLLPGVHLVQEQLAADLGVSRQPIQQAMALLKADGLVKEVGRRGMCVAALDMGLMRGHYDIRLVLDGYAARRAALNIASGSVDKAVAQRHAEKIFRDAKVSIESLSVPSQIRHDEALHGLIYELSGNPVLTESAEFNWRYLRRVMAAVLHHAEPISEIWKQHRAIIDAILAGDDKTAGHLAEEHVRLALHQLIQALERSPLEPVGQEASS